MEGVKKVGIALLQLKGTFWSLTSCREEPGGKEKKLRLKCSTLFTNLSEFGSILKLKYDLFHCQATGCHTVARVKGMNALIIRHAIFSFLVHNLPGSPIAMSAFLFCPHVAQFVPLPVRRPEFPESEQEAGVSVSKMKSRTELVPLSPFE